MAASTNMSPQAMQVKDDDIVDLNCPTPSKKNNEGQGRACAMMKERPKVVAFFACFLELSDCGPMDILNSTTRNLYDSMNEKDLHHFLVATTSNNKFNY
jgi:hypothetical protein